MNNNDGQVPEFEKFPGSGVESVGERAVPPEQDFAETMKDAPEFAEQVVDDQPEYNEGVADAAELVKYGLNMAAQELGVETVVQKIKGFDASGREKPIEDLFEYLGVAVPVKNYISEGAIKALSDMKELISEVEGADPRYEELRAGARAAGKGYFEYAVKDYQTRGLTELFEMLAQQREKVGTRVDSETTEGIKGDTAGETLNPEILQPDET